jgi:hypothetical protein
MMKNINGKMPARFRDSAGAMRTPPVPEPSFFFFRSPMVTLDLQYSRLTDNPSIAIDTISLVTLL